jgi:hypothetical protein
MLRMRLRSFETMVLQTALSPVVPSTLASTQRTSSTGWTLSVNLTTKFPPDTTVSLLPIDPEVATVSTLSNVQNSLFLPDLGNLYNRMPIIDLSRRRKQPKKRPSTHKMREVQHVSAFAEPSEMEAQRRQDNLAVERGRDRPSDPHRDADAREPQWIETESLDGDSPEIQRAPHVPRPWPTSRSPSAGSSSSSSSSSSRNSAEEDMRQRERLMRSMSTIRGEYAVLPAGIAWDDWTEDEKAELDDHVRHLMHSRRERFRRRLRGFRKFVTRPLGFLITLYAFLITFWGAAWVLFLIGM